MEKIECSIDGNQAHHTYYKIHRNYHIPYEYS